MTVILDGKKISEEILKQIRLKVEKLEIKPKIAVVLVGDNPASRVYVNKKRKTALEIGIESLAVELPENTSEFELEAAIDALNKDKSVDAILIQLPLPRHLNALNILEKIDPEKDVDGFGSINAGKIAIGAEPYCYPCTPAGILRILDEYKIEIAKKHVVIIGRSNIVGKPLAQMMLKRNATVTICHSYTQSIEEITKTADILVSAIGIVDFVTAKMVKQGAVVIDVGINRKEDKKLCGDVDFENVAPFASAITPVPGGIGPMTIAILMQNTLSLSLHRNKKIGV